MLIPKLVSRTAWAVLCTAGLALQAAGSVQIAHAKYGAGDKWVDVTPTVQKLIDTYVENQSSKYPNTMNAIFNGDPAHNKVKTVMITYKLPMPMGMPDVTMVEPPIGEYEVDEFWAFILKMQALGGQVPAGAANARSGSRK